MTAVQSPRRTPANPTHSLVSSINEHQQKHASKPIHLPEKFTPNKHLHHPLRTDLHSHHLPHHPLPPPSPWSSVSKSTNNPTTSIDPKTPPAHLNSATATSISQNQINHSPNESPKKSASKVSHVICKFYKAGNCSAGTACQFSHTLPEVGQGKPVCQWFVKGNCRFAHKCALAHILPGQPMSMDRKNKRAAQAAAREAAAASASGQSDPAGHSSPPPDAALELLDTDVQSARLHTASLMLAEPAELADVHDQSDTPSRLRPLKSPGPLPTLEMDMDAGSQHDELQFGLPDDFAAPHAGMHAAAFVPSAGPRSSHAFPSAFQPSSYAEHRQGRFPAPPYLHSLQPEPRRHVPISIDRACAWPREQSPGPFGAGSPFSAPGSRSVFLPRIGSFGSEDGFPRSAASAGASPYQAPLTGRAPEEEVWDQVEAGEEDVTELLPSSLHSLLTPEERHRQHIRKHAPPSLFSRSVPVEHLAAAGGPKGALARQVTAGRDTLSVSPAHGLVMGMGAAGRPQPATYLSSSYVPPATHFGGWEQAGTGSAMGGARSPPLVSAAHKERLNGGAFGHAPGTSLPQGLAAGLSRLHFQPALSTGLTPCGSPPQHAHRMDTGPLSPPRSPPASGGGGAKGQLGVPLSALSQRMAGLHFGSTAAVGVGLGRNNCSSPLGRNVCFSEEMESGGRGIGGGGGGGRGGWRSPGGVDEDDGPFRLEI